MNKRPKILVVGSFVMDQIMKTEVFPRPGQTVLGNGFHKAPGGKGANQAVQMALLGADVTMLGKLGRDSNGRDILETCQNAGVDMSKVVFDNIQPTGCAVIILLEANGGTENRIIVNPGSNMAITPDDVAFLKDEIASYDMVILQLEIPMEINELVARYAHEKGVPVMLNSAPSAPLSKELLSCLTFISPNETETEDLTGIHIDHEGDTVDLEKAKQAADVLREKGVQNVLITLGSGGAALFTGEGTYYSPCVKGVQVADPTAAGDSFVGAFCCAVSAGKNWEDALLYANHTAAITVSRMGAMPSLPTSAMVESALKAAGHEITL